MVTAASSSMARGRDTGDDGLVLGELLSTDGKCDGQDSGHGKGDTTDQEHKDVVETTTVRVVEGRVQDDNLEDNENSDGNQAERADLSENLLQVTSSVVVLANERCSTTEESVDTSGDDDTLGLTLLTGRATGKGVRISYEDRTSRTSLTRNTGHRASCSGEATRP